MTRSQRRWAALACLVSIAASVGALETPDFNFYPSSAISCLNEAADTANCERDTVPEMNECLCGNGGDFIINAATCLGEENNNDVQDVYTTMADACSDSNTPMSVSQQQFFAAVNGDLPSSSSSAPGPSSTSGSPSPSDTNSPEEDNSNNGNNNDDDNNGGLSQGAIIGIGAGAGVAGLLAIAGLAFFLIRRRRRRNSEESSPFISDYQYSKPTTFPPSEPSPGYGGFTDPKSWSGAAGAPTTAHSVSPNPTRLSSGWGSPPPPSQQSERGSQIYHNGEHHSAFASSPYDTPTIAELPPTTALPRIVEPAPVLAEMDGTGAPRRNDAIEMPGFTPGHY